MLLLELVKAEVDEGAAKLGGLTVLSCSWMIIMWSPRRMFRFRGDLPLRKSFTCESFSDSSACITVLSGRWACKGSGGKGLINVLNGREEMPRDC